LQPRKAEMSEVKFKVRHYALLLREFTVSDLVAATDLNAESIRTELQRMRKEGLLVSERPAKKQKGHPALYKLTSDPEKRLQLSQDVESFFPEPPRPFPPQPTSPHYLVANRIINRLEMSDYRTVEEQKGALQEVIEHLKLAEHEEDASEELINAYLNLQRARVEYLMEKYETSEILFRKAQVAFNEANLGHEAVRCHEYLTCIQFRQRCSKEVILDPIAKAHCILEILGAVVQSSYSPLTIELTNCLDELTRSTAQQPVTLQVVNAAWELMAKNRGNVARFATSEVYFRSRPKKLSRFVENWEILGGESKSWTSDPLIRQYPGKRSLTEGKA
jgi:chromosome segregation and condensation protein ScpB